MDTPLIFPNALNGFLNDLLVEEWRLDSHVGTLEWTSGRGPGRGPGSQFHAAVSGHLRWLNMVTNG